MTLPVSCPLVEFAVVDGLEDGKGGSGGGGESRLGEEDGVAFSMRAHVRYTSKRRSKVAKRRMDGYILVSPY